MAPVTRRSSKSKPGASGNAFDPTPASSATFASPWLKHKTISPTFSHFSPDNVIESIEGPQVAPGDNTIGPQTASGDFAILSDDSGTAAANGAHVGATLRKLPSLTFPCMSLTTRQMDPLPRLTRRTFLLNLLACLAPAPSSE
jgi:hypothetical protein